MTKAIKGLIWGWQNWKLSPKDVCVFLLINKITKNAIGPYAPCGLWLP